MKNHKTDLFWIHAYMLLTVLAYFLNGISAHEIIHFVGASSIAQAFFFAVSQGNGVLFVLCAAWMLAGTVGLIWFYLLAVIKKKTLPFFVLTALDLLISLFLGIWCLAHWESAKDLMVIFGVAVRLLYYLLMVRKEKPHEDET